MLLPIGAGRNPYNLLWTSDHHGIFQDLPLKPKMPTIVPTELREIYSTSANVNTLSLQCTSIFTRIIPLLSMCNLAIPFITIMRLGIKLTFLQCHKNCQTSVLYNATTSMVRETPSCIFMCAILVNRRKYKANHKKERCSTTGSTQHTFIASTSPSRS